MFMLTFLCDMMSCVWYDCDATIFGWCNVQCKDYLYIKHGNKIGRGGIKAMVWSFKYSVHFFIGIWNYHFRFEYALRRKNTINLFSFFDHLFSLLLTFCSSYFYFFIRNHFSLEIIIIIFIIVTLNFTYITYIPNIYAN